MEPPAGPSSGPYDYDLLVIGGTSGGLAVAKEAAGFRKKVLLLHLSSPHPRDTLRGPGGSWLSTDRLRRFFQVSSLLGEALQDSVKYGWRIPADAPHCWEDLVQTAAAQLESEASAVRREMKKSGVFYLNARGQITAPHTVQATDMEGVTRRFRAETLVIATGDVPRRLGLPGEQEYCITSEDLLTLPRPPGRTLVVGGSSEGLECAGFLLGLGQSVAVMPQPDILPGFERRMAEKIENHMFVAGVEFIYHRSLSQVERTADVLSGEPTKKRLQVSFTDKDGQTQQQHFDTVLVAVGGKACVDGLGLECVGVQCSQDTGRILTNERDQTSVDHIYAIGSVQHGRLSTAGLSVHAGKLLARRLYGEDNILCDYTSVPTVVLTPVEYAACGLSEENAKLTFGEANIEVYHSYYWPLEWVLPARNKNSCYVKAVCHLPDQERVVGLHIMGPSAGDILQGFATAMKCGLTKPQLDATVGIHPGSAQVLTSLTLTQRLSEALLLRGNC